MDLRRLGVGDLFTNWLTVGGASKDLLQRFPSHM